MSESELLKQEREVNSKLWNAPPTPTDSFGTYWAKVRTRQPDGEVESLEQSFRTREIDDEFTMKAFEAVFERNVEMAMSELPYKTVKEYKEHVKRLDGLKDRQKVTLILKDCIELIDIVDFSSIVGEDFKHEFSELLEKVQSRWYAKLSDTDTHAIPFDRNDDDHDTRFHEHLELIANAAFRNSFTTVKR